MTDEYRIEMQPPDQFRYNNAVPPLVVHQPISNSEQIHKSKYYENEVNQINIKLIMYRTVTLTNQFDNLTFSWTLI